MRSPRANPKVTEEKSQPWSPLPQSHLRNKLLLSLRLLLGALLSKEGPRQQRVDWRVQRDTC